MMLNQQLKKQSPCKAKLTHSLPIQVVRNLVSSCQRWKRNKSPGKKRKEKEEQEKMEAEQKRKRDKKQKRLPSSIKQNPSTLLLLPNNTTPNVL